MKLTKLLVVEILALYIISGDVAPDYFTTS